MDKIDHDILKILQQKARIPNVEVARTVGMAPSAVLERIKKLEAKGVIQGYEVRLDPEQFNCAMTAFVEIRVKTPASVTKTGQALAKIERIQEIHYIAGKDALLAKIKVADNQELEHILSRRIASHDAVAGTRTHIVLSTMKESAKIPLPKTIAQP